MSKAKSNETTPAATATRATPFTFTTIKNLTLPLLKLTDDAPAYISIDEPLKLGKKVDAKKDAAIITTVTNLETGETLQLLVPAVMQGILHDDFGAAKFGKKDPTDKNEEVGMLIPATEETYVGMQFSIIMHAKKAGKAYRGMSIAQIQVG